MLSGEVLVADSSPEGLAVLENQLVRVGLKVRMSLSGSMALRSIALRQPDILLIAFHLPDIGGLEVVRCLLADPHLRQLPVLLITSDPDAEHACTENGVDWLSMPIRPQELIPRIAPLLAQASLRRQHRPQ